jgi:hypothetical protein
MDLNSIQVVKKQFSELKNLGNKTFKQISEKDAFWQFNPQSNSIAIIVKHMHGNMLSRWTDFLTTDGEKEWRKRDEEFEAAFETKVEMITKWEEGWQCVFKALMSINETNIDTQVFIRGQKHSIEEACLRQLAHYASHMGQIVLLGKMLAGEKWQSLSIPKGDSKAFNDAMFKMQ